ncbi:hypothetical protein PGB90_009794 [Kerria lacca]
MSVSDKKYDPYDYGKTNQSIAFCDTIFHLIFMSMGPGLFSVPYLFKNIGYINGLLFTFFTVFLYAHNIRSMVKSEYEICKLKQIPNMTYSDVVFYAFKNGPSWLQWFAPYTRYISYVAFLAVWFGGNAILVLLISENFKSLLDYFYDTNIDQRNFILFLIVPLVLLNWIPNLKLIALCSMFSSIINMCCLVAILYTTSENLTSVFQQKQLFGDVTKIPYLMGTIFATINAAGLLLSLKREMRKPKKFNSKFGVMNLSYVPLGILFAVFGLLCYAKYGKNIRTNVILNLPEGALSKIVMGLYGLAMMFFFPLISYVTFDIIWNEIIKNKLNATSGVLKLQEYSIRTFIALFSILLAYAVPQITLFLSLAGTVGTSLDSIIFPAIVEILIFPTEKRYIFIFKNVLMIVFGIVLIAAGFSDSYSEIIHYFSK